MEVKVVWTTTSSLSLQFNKEHKLYSALLSREEQIFTEVPLVFTTFYKSVDVRQIESMSINAKVAPVQTVEIATARELRKVDMKDLENLYHLDG